MYTLTPEAEKYLGEHPDAAPLFDYIAAKSTEFPALGDMDAYAPDPYMTLYKAGGAYEDIPDDELELAIETVHALGLERLSDISPEARTQLFHAGVNWTDEAYARVKQVSGSLPPEHRAQFAEAFLATEFGDDFGDILLDLADANEPMELSPVLERINTIRQNGAQIAEIFGKDFAMDKRGAVAFIKRTTELLALAKLEGLESVRDTLGDLDSAIADAAASLHGEFKIIDATTEYGTLQSVERPITMTVRPYGDNARLGITVRRPGKERLSMRLDYEPEEGAISLDIGSIAQSANISSLGRRVGTTLARAELALVKLRAEKAIARGEEQQTINLYGNHVREAFADLQPLEPAEFSRIVMHALYRLRPVDAKNSRTVA